MTSPTERASGVTMGVILTPEFGRAHRDELSGANIELGQMSKKKKVVLNRGVLF